MLTNERGTPKVGGVEYHLVIVEDEDVFSSIDKLLVEQIRKQFREEGKGQLKHLHDQILTPPYELRLGVDDGLEEPQVLHMLAMALNAVDKVLNHLLVHFVAQNCIVLQFSTMSILSGLKKHLEDCTHGLCMEQVWVQEQLKVFVKKHLKVLTMTLRSNQTRDLIVLV